MVQLVVIAAPIESTAFAVKLNVPAVVGAPVMAPVVAFNVRPAGRLPEEIENVYGPTPPIATSAELYATPTWAVTPGQASAIGADTVIVQLVVAAVPVESTSLTVKLNVPAVVGVPAMAPVVVFSVRPGGRLPEEIENV